jgi:hypothetical protein
MSGREGNAALARCPSCGGRPGASPGAQKEEPITHCEWCGAEYPVPESGPGAPGGRHAAGEGGGNV